MQRFPHRRGSADCTPAGTAAGHIIGRKLGAPVTVLETQEWVVAEIFYTSIFEHQGGAVGRSGEGRKEVQDSVEASCEEDLQPRVRVQQSGGENSSKNLIVVDRKIEFPVSILQWNDAARPVY